MIPSLPPYQTVKLNEVEMNQHQIDPQGNSPLYPDHVASIVHNHAVKVIHHFYKGPYEIPEAWRVTMIPKADLVLDLNTPTKLSQKAINALLLEDSGFSRRPELSKYTFQINSSDNGSFTITKKEK